MKKTNYKVVFKEKCWLFFDRVYLTYRKPKWVRRTVRTDTSSHWKSGWACKWVWARVLKEWDGVSRSWSLMFMDAGGGAGVGGCLWNENGSLAEHRTLCCPQDQFTDLLAESLSELATPALRGVEDKLRWGWWRVEGGIRTFGRVTYEENVHERMGECFITI